MQVIPPFGFATQPWKNGGGITHEIARSEEQDALLWRLSIAEVGTDGPFSAFPGLARILTVIDGKGLILDTPEGRLSALPFAPLAFPGDLPAECSRIAGAVRDFNVIYDPARIRAAVRVLDAGTETALDDAPGRLHALLSLGPDCRVGGSVLPEGAVALLDRAARTATEGAPALVAVLDRV
ncbi:HutD/Ves family protein [Defluviimonas salinarum]|uniref:HutD family protein n=1 Tax=Defluviimonas salinarum TaxID=2992147 RepID=A0ABT3IZX5_9RHOB|nr:HutD family protein [Defluviimonas salinarum]MCW3780989.1 HutD family protein [Defluviimonas salinarum]